MVQLPHERGDCMDNRRPVKQILVEIKRKMEQKKLGSVALSELIEANGRSVGRGKIDRLFYGGVNRSVYVDAIDDTVEAILEVFGMTTEDLFKSILNEDSKVRTQEEKELIDFALDEKARPYLKVAMAQYKIKRAEEELEKLKSQIK